MAQPMGSWWEVPRSESARDVLGWAATAELGPDVGSRGLLVGLLRTSASDDARTLLEHFGIAEEIVFDALRKRDSAEHRLDPNVRAPAEPSDSTRSRRPAVGAADRLGVAAGWPRLVLLVGPSSSRNAELPPVRGVGFFVRPRIVATAAELVAPSGQSMVFRGEATGIVPEARDEQIALARVDGAFEHGGESFVSFRQRLTGCGLSGRCVSRWHRRLAPARREDQ